jgi:hypothetical protein
MNGGVAGNGCSALSGGCAGSGAGRWESGEPGGGALCHRRRTAGGVSHEWQRTEGVSHERQRTEGVHQKRQPMGGAPREAMRHERKSSQEDWPGCGRGRGQTGERGRQRHVPRSQMQPKPPRAMAAQLVGQGVLVKAQQGDTCLRRWSATTPIPLGAT